MEQKNEDWQVEFENVYRDWIQDSSIKSIKGFFAPIIEEAEKRKEREVLESFKSEAINLFMGMKGRIPYKQYPDMLGRLIDHRLTALEGKEYGTKE